MAGQGGRKPPLVAERRPPKTAKKKGVAKGKTVAKRSKPRPVPRRRGPLAWLGAALRWAFGLILGFGLRMALIIGLMIAGGVLYFHSTIPPLTDLLDARTRGSVTLLDREGQIFAWRGDQFGGQITAETVAPVLKNAVVATEDKRFYRHFGVDPRGVAGAIRINLREGRGPLSGNGGSTITQQTAKLLCLGTPYDPETWASEAAYEADCRRTTLWRKVKEAIYAMALEARFSKDEILTIYLNRAYLGAGARGFEAAAERYFGKSANQVSAPEAAMLAGLLKAPSTYAPTRNMDAARNRANLILGLMADQGYLTEAEAQTARANPAQLSEAAAARAGGYFADWIMETGPAFLTRDTTEDVIIRTTFDRRLQTAAEEALAHVFETKVKAGSTAEAAIIVMSADGAVRAMVGGRQTKVSGAFNRATMALRQPGSAFKPFVYAAALDLGFTPNATVVDEPITIDVPGSGPYTPANYDRKFHGRVTLTEALVNSLNIPAIRVSESVGRENVRRIAADFGIDSDIAQGPAIALGASETTLIEMTGAYAGILNGGTSVKPYGLIELRLQGDSAPLIGQAGGFGERVISDRAARSLTWMMYQVVERGTAKRAKLTDRQAAGKTGTTQAARDAWFVGFTADYVVGVWMGNDDNTPLANVTGGGLPADIWRETMIRVNEGLPPRPLPMDAPAPEAPDPQKQPSRDPAEQVLEQVLRTILGQN